MAALAENERQVLVDGIIENCDCWDEEDRETLNSFNDDKLRNLAKHVVESVRNEQIASAAGEGFKDESGNSHIFNTETGEWETRRVDNGDPPEPNPAPRSPATLEEWLAAAPEEARNAFKNAQAVEKQQKDEIIAQLTANLEGAEKSVQRERLYNRSLDDLRADLALLPKQPPKKDDEPTGNEDTSWLKTALSSVGRKVENEDPLLPPTINYSSGDLETPTTSPASLAKPEDEWVKHAPAGIREVIENAVSIERRERNEIIDQLTANVEDSNARFRLRDWMSEKSSEELRNLLALTGNKTASKGRKPNYSGAAAPTGNVSSLPDDEKNDILTLPVMNYDDERKQA